MLNAVKGAVGKKDDDSTGLTGKRLPQWLEQVSIGLEGECPEAIPVQGVGDGSGIETLFQAHASSPMNRAEVDKIGPGKGFGEFPLEMRPGSGVAARLEAGVNGSSRMSRPESLQSPSNRSGMVGKILQ